MIHQKFPAEERMNLKLRKREEESLLRKIPEPITGIDFCSNDYLGLSKIQGFKFQQYPERYFGSGGSRLISGNYKEAEQLENKIAQFHHFESALLFNSGYVANTGLLSCIAERNDTILYDEYVHASIREGIRLSHANAFSFTHNTISDLEAKSKNVKGTVFVVVESLYSMDGDFAPLADLVTFCKKNNFQLIVDEAHSAGLLGQEGRGMVHQLGICRDVFALVVTYGKAFASHGAAVLGNQVLKEYLINFSRPFIYTTAMPLVQLEHINYSYEKVSNAHAERSYLLELIAYFNEKKKNSTKRFLHSSSAIQVLCMNGNDEAKSVALQLEKNNIAVKAILSPTVPLGKERIRICLHASNTKSDIDLLFSLLHD